MSSPAPQSWRAEGPQPCPLLSTGHWHQCGGSGAVSSPVASRWCPSRTRVSGGTWGSLWRGGRQGQTWGSLGRDRRWGRGRPCSPGLLPSSWAAARPSFAVSHSEKSPSPGRRGPGPRLYHRHLQKGPAGPHRRLLQQVPGGCRGCSPTGAGEVGPPRPAHSSPEPPRYSYNEEEGELPEWFTEEERQHRRRQLPVDKQTVEAYRQRWREINARPIKKVAEAKARKKRRVSAGWAPRGALTPLPGPQSLL